jgi:ATP-binding cassette subfamily B protein
MSELPVPGAIRLASDQSLAAAIASRLPEGYRQMLGRWFKGGVELSGGEWQKIALARTYMRLESAQILVLDEPTAALDARAEAFVFEQFRALVRRRASLVISHRFSTVRMADRIIVLERGRIIDDGSHLELMARRGLYAELFELQAAGYQ